MAILGIDEVGRGPWAGPLCIGAVILEDATADWTAALTDSKKLTPKKRSELAPIILEQAKATALGWVSSKELDALGMTAALSLATRRAVLEIQHQKVPFSEIIIDGTINFLYNTKLENYVTTLKKADLLIKEVSAASIIAKVARDSYMINLATQYPGYGFERHMGYGTALHQAALKELGPCPEHRRSFRPVAELDANNSYPTELESNKITTKSIGDKAENMVANFLEEQGHCIISRNHKTKFYEIDIVSLRDNKIYFTEVKYRKNSTHGSPVDMVNQKKLKQMKFAAEAFLKFQPNLQKFDPLLAVASVLGPEPQLTEWFVIK